MSQTKCPHCGFMNGPMSAYCKKCERPMRAPEPMTGDTVISPPPVRPPVPMVNNDTVISPPPRAPSQPSSLPAASSSATGAIRGMPPPASRPPVVPSRPAPIETKAPPAALTTSKVPAAFERLGSSRRPTDPFTLPDFAPIKPPEPSHDAKTVVRKVTLPPESGELNLDLDLDLEPTPPAAPPSQMHEPTRTNVHEAPRGTQSESDRTVIPAPRASYLRLVGAMLLDGCLGLVVALAAVGSEMLLFAGRFPADKGGPLEALASWLSLYPNTVMRATTVTMAFALGYCMWGSRRGRTLGRQATGLIALRASGVPISWPLAVWRALVSMVSLLFFGAGYFWIIVDGSHRSWHDVLSNSVVVRRRGR